MLHACIMSGHEGVLDSEQRVYLTFMAGIELRAPTIARQIVARRNQPEPRNGPAVRQVFLTLLGGASIRVPTVTEEFMDFRDLIQSGKISLGDWDQHATDAQRTDVQISTFTVMGGFSDGELPSDDAEVDALAIQRHLGNIPEGVGEILKLGIGQRGGERRAILRRAVADWMNGAAV